MREIPEKISDSESPTWGTVLLANLITWAFVGVFVTLGIIIGAHFG